MEYHLDHLKSVEKILQSRKELESLLNNVGNYFPAPSTQSRGGGRRGRGSYRSFNNRGGPSRELRREEPPEDEVPPPVGPMPTPPRKCMNLTMTVTLGAMRSKEPVRKEKSASEMMTRVLIGGESRTHHETNVVVGGEGRRKRAW